MSFDDLDFGSAGAATPVDSSSESESVGESSTSVERVADTASPLDAALKSKLDEKGNVEAKPATDPNAPAPAAKPPKAYKVKVGDQSVDIQGDTPLKVTVDGKPQDVPLQELINNYAGKTNWDKRYQDLATERKAFGEERQGLESDKTQLRNTVTHIYKTFVEENNPQAAIESLAEALGETKPFEIWSKFRDQVFDSHKDSFISMMKELGAEHPEKVWDYFKEKGIKARDVEAENAYYKRRDERTKVEAQAKADYTDIKGRLDKIATDHKTDLASLSKVYQELLATKKYKPEDITPEFVGDVYRQLNIRDGVATILDSMGQDVENKEVAFKELREAWYRNPELTQEDIKEIAHEVYGNKTAKSLSRKVKKQEPSRTTTGKPATNRNSQEDAVTFDDL